MIADRRSRAAAWLGAIVAGLVLAVMPAASPAVAATPQEQQAAQKVAAEHCAKMRAAGTVPDRYKDACEQRLADDLLSGAAGKPGWVDAVCQWFPDLPLLGNPCKDLLSSLAGAWDEFQSAAKGAVDLVTNPVGTVFKYFAATLSDAVKSLIGKIFPELVHISSPDLGSESFLSAYAAGAGLAIIVLVVMLARLFYGASQDDITGEELADALWRWVPTALLAILFGPGLGYLLVSLSDSASLGIIQYFTGDINLLVTKLDSLVVLGDSAGIPGGSLVGVVIELIALLGLMGLLGGMLVQLLAIYLTGAIMAVVFAMLVDPRTRKKALKVPFTWVGLTFTKPVLFFFVGAISRMADSAFSAQSIKDDSIRSLVTAVVAAMALLILGLAPWTLLKFAPVLPDGSSARVGRASKSQGGGALGGLANSTMMQMGYRRMGSSGQGGGGQQASAGGGDLLGGSGGGPSSQKSPALQSRQTQGQQSTVSGGAAPAGGAATGSAAAAPAGGAATPVTAGAGAGAGVAGAGGASAAGGAAAGASGASGAAAAGAGAATGGVATAALLGVQAANAAKRKASDAAHRASDLAPEG